MAQKRSVRWSLVALVLVNTLLLIVLVLTEQLRWLPSPWPLSVTRKLFQAFLATSAVHAALLGPTGIGSAVYLYRRRATDERADPMKLLRRAFIAPAVYVLSALWSWSWLAGRSPRHFGAALVVLWGASQIAHFVYFTARTFRQARAARASGTRSLGPARPSAPAIKDILRTRAQKVRRALRRQWWLLTHRDYIKRLPAAERALFVSVVRGVTQNVEVLLRRGADPNLRLLYGDPLINLCASLGRTEAARLLLDAGADIDAASPPTGFTALHGAADKGNLALVRLLVERGARLEARLGSGSTALTLAARRGHTEVVRLLLENGVSVDASARNGQTPLMSAALYGHAGVAKALLGGGADPSARNASGRTALDYAKMKGHHELSEMLSRARDRMDRSGAVP